jgi:alpha-ketoglutaric semialdehyde dehydrogenase
VVKAVKQCGLPAGVFALLTGIGNDIGQALVAHPAIQAVGFTGSRAGGQALMAVAAARPQPVPVYAEMSSINPVFLMPRALEARGEEIASPFANAW